MRVKPASFVSLPVLAVLAIFTLGANAAEQNLINSTAWTFYASGSVQNGTLTVGDSVGYDTSDSDNDNNPYNSWFGTGPKTGQGVDYDEAITTGEYAPPLSVRWTGCFPITRYGYNNIFIGRKNTEFRGETGSRQYPIIQEFGFTNRWDYSGMNTIVTTGSRSDVQLISAATASGNNYCGDYRIDWNNDLVEFYFNGTKVRSQTYAYQGPVSILVRSFDLPHTISAMTINATVTNAQRPAQGAGLASVFGANISGQIRNTSTGASTPLNTSNAAISGDVVFATRDDGKLSARVTGHGGAQGMSFRYSVDYDLTNNNLTGSVTDNTSSTQLPVTFNYRDNLTWRGTIQNGSGRSSSGEATTYEVSFDIVLPQAAITMGPRFPPNSRFLVDLNRSQPIEVPISIPLLNLNTSFTTFIVTEGQMIVTLVPTGLGAFALTGDVEGAFRMDPPIQLSTQYRPTTGFPGVTLPPVTINITIDATGRYAGNLTGNTAENNLRFVGNFSAVSSEGSTIGGTLNMPIPLGSDGGVPATAEMTVAGVVKLSISGIPANLPITVPNTIPFSQVITVPLEFQSQ